MTILIPSPDPYPPSEFDAWADTYDQEVAAQGGFPFLGYSQVIDTVIATCSPFPGASVLDLGTGTGMLAGRFFERGCSVLGVDYSPAMLDVARQKNPNIPFRLADIRCDWLDEFDQAYDRIVSTYTFHHFPLADKVRLVRKFAEHSLSPGGHLVIADISFPNQPAMDNYRRLVDDTWEMEEYWFADEAILALQRAGLVVEYRQVSQCAGVYLIVPGK